jgi:hypothetical protein
LYALKLVGVQIDWRACGIGLVTVEDLAAIGEERTISDQAFQRPARLEPTRNLNVGIFAEQFAVIDSL